MFAKLKKNYKVYTPFTLNQIKQNFAYKGRFYLFILCKLFGVFVSFYLWSAIFDSSSNPTLGGFTKSEMITYIFISYISSGIVYISIARDIGSDVVDGSIAINLIKPIEYRTKLFFQAFGDMIYKLVMPSIFIWIGVEIYRVNALGLSITPVNNMLLFLLSSFFSFLIYFLFDFCFGMMAFYTTYVWGMNIVKNAVLNFLTGQLIPLSFFPGSVQKFFDFLPFKSMNYTPVMIYLGKYSSLKAAAQIGLQIVWVAMLYLISSYLWKRVTRRLTVLGG